ncbi:nuclear pore complex protein Nup50 [Nephila pilipes]|uniref:Nuclear pore complex protein Nup50 n=1 Tax=Nephila pilipes TaxID=299642 RepID=A0A8X6NC89_NEPPI|nr:nuclear pore complex protein Nup50 [Nephila pilipes]
MAKRSASSQLNQDNWDSVDEKEEAGTFTPLSKNELQHRVIRKAKRSLNNSTSDGSPKGFSPFAKFSGFGSAAPSSAFGTTKKIDSQFGPVTKTDSPFSAAQKETEKSNGNSIEQEKSSGDISKPSTSSENKCREKQARNLEYYRQLQSLNESVLKWMQMHLSKNSCCDFTPVFNDYKKHLDTLNVTYPVKMKESTFVSESKDNFKKPMNSEEAIKDSTNQFDSHDKSSFQKEKSNKNEDETDYGANFSSNTTNTSTFSFGIKSTPTPTSSSSSSGCTSSSKEGKEKEGEESKPAPFSFGLFNKTSQPESDKPFSFACAPIEKSTAPAGDAEDQEYVPPKNEFVSVKEEGAVYSKRCKLFFKKDKNYADKGIGTLHLKPLDGKTQLLIRADTNLGNILLNIVLNASLPMSRTGKNNVLLVCIPNPPVDVKDPDSKEAIPMLIRVKTEEEADELLETLNKYKS